MKRSRESENEDRKTRRSLEYMAHGDLYNLNNELFNFSTNNNTTILDMIQSVINFIPSIQNNSYPFLDLFFKKSLFANVSGWNPTPNAIFMYYNSFINTCRIANESKSNAQISEGLYPVGSDPMDIFIII
jgi:hypothetical protein